MDIKKQVLTSKSGSIGGHKIVGEIGLVKTQRKPPIIGGAYDSYNEGLEDLKDIARSKGANGLINIEKEASLFNGKPISLSGFAVVVEPSK